MLGMKVYPKTDGTRLGRSEADGDELMLGDSDVWRDGIDVGSEVPSSVYMMCPMKP